MSKKKIITLALIAVGLLGGVAYFRGNEQKPVAQASTASAVSVKVYKVNSVAKDSTLSYKANLEASQEGVISGKVGGKVVQIMFENGTYVSKGQALVKLDAQDIQNNIASMESKIVTSKLNIQRNQVSIDNAQLSYNRTKELFAQGAVTKTDLENAVITLKNAKNDLAASQANLNSNLIELKSLRESLANTTITAPISGVVDEKNVSLGQYANMGTVLGKVKTISPIYAVIEVDQNDINALKVGQSAKVKIGTSNVKEYKGTVKNIEVSADTTTRVFKCIIQVANQDQVLKPGIYATVEIESNKSMGQTLAVSTDALSGTEGDYSVFMYDKGVARERAVSIGEITNGMVEIKSGLKKGESVIITNVNTLLDGDKVKVVTE